MTPPGTITGKGTFTGVGVGPGPEGYIAMVSVQALNEADIILVPRAKQAELSVAAQCLRGLNLPEEKFLELTYNMDTDVRSLQTHYNNLALQIAELLNQGKRIVYLTIGDTLTYSTYSYMLQTLLKFMPDLQHRTIPGITSYAAIAAALDWPVGQGKETTLILPCPEDMGVLRQHIETHDIVILMKIGRRMKSVLRLLKDMRIAGLCGLASRIGLPGEFVCKNLAELEDDGNDNIDYLSTMLIRKSPSQFSEAVE